MFGFMRNLFGKVEETVVETPQVIDPTIPKRVALATIKRPINYKVYEDYIYGNMPHQQEAFNKIKYENLGQVILPTGSGKTRVQIAIQMNKMIELHKKGECGVFVIAAHRLALCAQLMDDMLELVVASGIPFDVLTIGSSKFSRENVEKLDKAINKHTTDVLSTLESLEIASYVHNSHTNGRQVICVSTYHSFDRLNVLPNVTICTYDEAHTLVTDAVEGKFMNNILTVKPKINFNFFFTATRKVRGNTGGMNNTEIFGKVLASNSPREMIDAGVIIPPKIHRLDAIEQGDYTNDEMYVKSVIEGYKKHKEFVNKSCDWLGAKLLISNAGSEHLFMLHDNVEFKAYCVNNGVKVFAFSSSDDRGCSYNFEKMERSRVISEMDAMGDTENAILLHIDILTEGIDLPSITGVMPFRELNDIKLLQTIGRGTRLLKSDRSRIRNGELKIGDWKNYHKPVCWILFPEYLSYIGDTNAMKATIRCVANEYKIPTMELVVGDNFLTQKNERLENLNEQDAPTRRNNVTDIKHTEEEIYIENAKSMFMARSVFDVVREMFPNPSV